MIQDRSQKVAALRYVVARRWFPQLELDVSTRITLSRTPTTITDVDVFASVPDEFVGYRGVAIDCKTRKSESPITRALWQKGLIERLGVDRGICVLRIPRIEADHRYTAAQLGVTLLAESEFDAFADATAGSDYRGDLGAVADLGRWEQYFAVPKRFPALGAAVHFSRSAFWMAESDAEACTRTIYLMNTLRTELDPARAEHLAVVADITALFLHALARIVGRTFAWYLQPAQRKDLAAALLLLLYGGRNSYNHLNRIKKLLASSASGGRQRARRPIELAAPRGGADRAADAAAERGDGARDQEAEPGGVDAEAEHDTRAGARAVPDLSLPRWDRFVELVRQMLDAPLDVAHAPLIVREVGWAALGEAAAPDGVTPFARRLAAASPQGARFTVLGLEYLCAAARLPREFAEVLGARLFAAQTRA